MPKPDTLEGRVRNLIDHHRKGLTEYDLRRLLKLDAISPTPEEVRERQALSALLEHLHATRRICRDYIYTLLEDEDRPPSRL
jgi:hypothetical protein